MRIYDLYKLSINDNANNIDNAGNMQAEGFLMGTSLNNTFRYKYMF